METTANKDKNEITDGAQIKKRTRRRRLGRMTSAEYQEMTGEKPCRMQNLRRLTDDEYKNLEYGNREFYNQFKK